MRVIFICGLLAITSACASRTPPPAGVPSPQPASKPSDPPAPPAPVTEPVSSPTIPTPRLEPSSAECALIAEPGMPVTTIALGEAVDPSHAPRPSNESERLVFRQLYETLVRVDCMERVIPGLAASWRRSIDGRTWIVSLRDGARFSDGTPVAAATIVALWSRDGVGGDLQPYVNRLVQSIISVDEKTLAISLRSPHMDAPMALAHTDLAIARQGGGSEWPIGTRPASAVSTRDAVTITSADTSRTIRFLSARDDLRDVLDEAVDLAVTRDRAALDYAATLPQFQSIPLPWERLRVLLLPGRAKTAPVLSVEAREAFAADAIRGEARGAVRPFWWPGLPACEMAPPQWRDPAWRPTTRVVYDATDDAARDIAERLVGLAGAAGGSPRPILDALLPDRPRRNFQRAVGLTGEAFVLALRGGGDAAYVMSLDSRPFDPCRELQVVVEGAPWLDPATIVPLVDTRQQAIVRRGHSGIVVDWDGGLLIASVEDQRKE